MCPIFLIVQSFKKNGYDKWKEAKWHIFKNSECWTFTKEANSLSTAPWTIKLKLQDITTLNTANLLH